MDKISIFFIAILCSFFLSTNISIAQNNSHSLKIQIVGLISNNGKVLLQLFNNKNEIIAKETAIINNKRCSISIPNLKQGKYSIRYFHDENDNDKLDTNWFGIPIEGYGFSNNAVSMFGTPSIKDRLFNISNNKKILLKIKY